MNAHSNSSRAAEDNFIVKIRRKTPFLFCKKKFFFQDATRKTTCKILTFLKTSIFWTLQATLKTGTTLAILSATGKISFKKDVFISLESGKDI